MYYTCTYRLNIYMYCAYNYVYCIYMYYTCIIHVHIHVLYMYIYMYYTCTCTCIIHDKHVIKSTDQQYHMITVNHMFTTSLY